MPPDATTTEHPTDRSNAFVVTSSWLSRRHFLLLLPPPRSLLFHPCIGFGLHRAAAAEKTYDSAETGSSIYLRAKFCKCGVEFNCNNLVQE